MAEVSWVRLWRVKAYYSMFPLGEKSNVKGPST
jgi:hypothetical protein